ncbi:MAG TPA: cbb3-type cytochrome c oxidase N-terminal domain-containing protein [Prolixibacteraceae bacterium]|nr:cbb3-type cytochrome c oxidase N-terminal domain-containing protein [Prolixibacteraceae bacterium]
MSANIENNNNNNTPEIDEVTQTKYFGDDYDGIRELDNRLPPWLKYVFYITIIFAAGYLSALWLFDNENLIQAEEYKNNMAEAEARLAELNRVIIDESNIEIVTGQEELASGKETFDKICSVCHGKFGEGLVGPNFTDNYWIHGNSIKDMYNVVINGVLEKGMISYKDQLSGEQIQNVLGYIISLQGTNPPNQKAPEGEPYEGILNREGELINSATAEG